MNTGHSYFLIHPLFLYMAKASFKNTKAAPVKPVKKKVAGVSSTTPAPKEQKVSLKHLPLEPTKISQGRYFFTKETDDFSMPNLLEVQVDSYRWFMDEGIGELLEEISPISDFSGKKIELHFLSHSFDDPKYTVQEAKRKNINYEIPLKAHVQLINKESGEIKEQDVYLGSIPLMTERGTFIINGIERVIVNQIVRSPGVFFSENLSAPGYFNAKIIPKRGAWLEIETDKKGIISVKIDRKRKAPITSLLRAFGHEKDSDIIKLFDDVISDPKEDFIMLTLEKDPAKNVDEACQQIYKRIRPGDLATPENAKSLIDSMFFDFKKYDMGHVARYKLNQRFNLKTPFDTKHRVFQVEDLVHILKYLIRLNKGEGGGDDIDHLSNRRIRSVGELVQNKMRVGLLRTERIAKDRMTVLDLESVTPTQLINSRPITAALKEFFSSSQLSQFMDQTNPLAELEHKRRISAMGPGGLSRERASFEVRDVHSSHYGRICPIATPEGPNIGLVVHLASYAKVNKYGFIETPYREVHHTVPNTVKDLVNKIARGGGIIDPKTKTVIVKDDEYITEAQAKLINQKIKEKEIPVRAYLTKNVQYYDSGSEKLLIIAQANSELDRYGNFLTTRVSARKNGEPILSHVNDITHIDVSPKQILSVTTALIPFVEHDDSTRASMGTNMQRQAVPLLKPQAPIVGTGMERVAAENSGYLVTAEDNGEITYVDASKIIVMYQTGKKVSYPLETFSRSNQGTIIHQVPVVTKNQKVRKGDVLADGQSIDHGELALGRNLLVAYISWYGYNYEDAVIISERVFQKDWYSSIHIEDFSIDVRDTKLGSEIVTRDIPNVGETKLKDLDEDGIVRIGATVNEGDILVGKITPKGEAELTAEERLLQAIFGEKAKDVKDTSLRLPGGEGGKVVDINILTRENSDELPTGVIKQIKVYVAQTRKVEVGDKMAGRHGNKGIISNIVPVENMPYLEDGTPVDIVLNPLGVVSRMNIGQILETHLGWAASKFNITVATPALNGISTDQIHTFLVKAGLPEDGKVQLYNGFTGEPFEEKTTVGIAYMMKLHHLVEDKIHARSVGPYSLVTQQPLGGKAQHGGQRFGEMEVWALEAYGAAYTLQEMLTIKSDDVRGRSKSYESIVKGEEIKAPHIPESFNVLVKELQSLCLRVDLLTPDELSLITREETGYGLTGLIEGEFDESDEGGEVEEKIHPKTEDAEGEGDDIENTKELREDDAEQDTPLVIQGDEDGDEEEDETM
jgi:DNA-directed RNA polymerase subunit beta